MKTVSVSASRQYEILIERGLLRRAGELVRSVTNAGTVMLVSDDSVWPLYGETVQKSLAESGFSVCRFVFPHGENSKCAKTYLALLNALCENRLTRADAVVALGGGVVGDLTGFAASTYLRGIGFIQIPTTLLAMVDSSVGGKTAIDLPAGKNLAGVIRQPLAVFIDPDCLATLPEAALAAGMAEAVKTGILAGEELWPLVAAPEPDYFAVLCDCAAYKAAVVSQEEQDTGIRLSLNLGHTVGHAVERHSGYAVSHGEAVAIGLATMARAGAALGWCDSITAERIKTALKRRGLPLCYRCKPEELLPYLWADKKRQGEELTVVLPHRIGYCSLRRMKEPQLLRLLREGL